jgi:hypothetical protein
MPNSWKMFYQSHIHVFQLLHKDKKFFCSSACESAFLKLENMIASNSVLTPFNTSLPIVVSCVCWNSRNIVSRHQWWRTSCPLFVSRSLTDSERNYSQLDREALAIYWTIKKLYMYLYGQKFTLVTNNKYHQRTSSTTMTDSPLAIRSISLRNPIQKSRWAETCRLLFAFITPNCCRKTRWNGTGSWSVK